MLSSQMPGHDPACKLIPKPVSPAACGGFDRAVILKLCEYFAKTGFDFHHEPAGQSLSSAGYSIHPSRLAPLDVTSHQLRLTGKQFTPPICALAPLREVYYSAIISRKGAKAQMEDI
ncbi:MAG: hypothetical protein U9N87_00135 [Planctomycetota bacterium]|nr:hypothetical protein [Planctomycetota bacterium]